MNFELVSVVPLDLQHLRQWLWYSGQNRAFITGDGGTAFALPVATPRTRLLLTPARDPGPPGAWRAHPCNLPIPVALYDEFSRESWNGLFFLDAAAYERAVDAEGKPVGDLVSMLVSGPDYGQYLVHPASDMILGLRAGSIELLKRAGDGGFTSLAKTRTRGCALTFAAHPTETLLVYGDNQGDFHAHRFGESGFGKATRIAAKQRKASAARFVDGGGTLLIGGMGYLASLTYADGKFTPAHETSIPVREFKVIEDESLATVFVNQGMHGVTAFGYDNTGGFQKLGAFKPDAPVQQLAVSSDTEYLAVTAQATARLGVYRIT